MNYLPRIDSFTGSFIDIVTPNKVTVRKEYSLISDPVEGTGTDRRREASIDINSLYDISIDEEDRGLSSGGTEKPTTYNSNADHQVYIASPVIGNNERKNHQSNTAIRQNRGMNSRPTSYPGSSQNKNHSGRSLDLSYKDNICPYCCIICPY